jgi:gliding motility-associated-like protein
MKQTITIIALLVGLNAYNQVYIPNSFTPNNDGLNDYLAAYTLDTLSLFELKIYNMYGEKVHDATDIGDVWTGGQFYYAPDGQYTYILIWRKLGEQSTYTKQGYINLIR